MAKSPVIFFGALVALLASLLAMLLVWLGNGDSWLPNFIKRFLEGPLLYGALGLAVLASLALVAVSWRGSLGESRLGAREKVVYRVDPVSRYRTAVEMAWADGKLIKAEKERLVRLVGELGLSRDQAARVEREVMGLVKEEVELHEPEERVVYREKVVYRTDPVVLYRAAVEMAWADGKLIKAEEKRLGALELDLEISGGEAEEIECEVMGGTREEVVLLGDEISERYRAAVRMAWADEKLSKREKEYLELLEGELGLSPDKASKIEREVMGKGRGEIETQDDPPPPPPDDEAWEKLVEECVGVVDELDRHMAAFDPERQELADHVMLRLEEVLERSGVDIISDDETFDSKRHKPEKATTKTSPGAHITETLSPGFAVGRRVLRRAKVRVE